MNFSFLKTYHKIISTNAVKNMYFPFKVEPETENSLKKVQYHIQDTSQTQHTNIAQVIPTKYNL